MEVDFGGVLHETGRRLADPFVALLIGCFSVLGFAEELGWTTFTLQGLAVLSGIPDQDGPAPGSGLFEGVAGGLGFVPGVVLWLGASVASLALLVVAIESFAGPSDRSWDHVPERFVWKTGNLIVGWVLYGVVVLIGAAFLVVPGVLLAALLAYYPVAIVVEEAWVGKAFARSLEVFTENLLASTVVAVLIGAAFVARYVASLAAQLVIPTEAAVIAPHVFGAIYWVLAFALLTRTFVSASEPRSDADVVGEGTDPRGGSPV